MTQLFKKIIFPNPKFRIVCRNNKYVPQEFLGIWKLGLYADLAKQFNHSDIIPLQFEHDSILDADLVIERRRKQLKTNKYVVRDYFVS